MIVINAPIDSVLQQKFYCSYDNSIHKMVSVIHAISFWIIGDNGLRIAEPDQKIRERLGGLGKDRIGNRCITSPSGA